MQQARGGLSRQTTCSNAMAALGGASVKRKSTNAAGSPSRTKQELSRERSARGAGDSNPGGQRSHRQARRAGVRSSRGSSGARERFVQRDSVRRIDAESALQPPGK